MPYKDPAERRRMSREYARRNRAKMNREYRARKRRVIVEAKTGPCVCCGTELPPKCMHLDHVRGDKHFTIGSWWATVGMQKLKEEIAKCDLLCPNCHALKHHVEANGVPSPSTTKTHSGKGRKPRKR